MKLFEKIAKWQKLVFFDIKCKIKVISKGRRLGFTEFALRYCIVKLIENRNSEKYPILWVDTVNSNLDRYMKRIVLPILNKLPKKYAWKYNETKKVLTFGNAYMDLRSAESPENMEGFSYKLCVINEAGIVLKNSYLYTNTILPMMMDYPEIEMIIGGTPKGRKSRETDFNSETGEKKRREHMFFTLAKNAVKYSDYKNLSTEEKLNTKSVYFKFSSYYNPFIPKENIDEYKLTISSAIRKQEIDGEFIDSQEFKIFHREWIKFYTEDIREIKQGITIQSWDTALKKGQENDYSACTTWFCTENSHYLLDCYLDKLEYPELISAIQEKAKFWKPSSIFIESAASGISACQSLRANTRLPIREIQVKKDKILRANLAAPTFESGKVLFPKNKMWVDSTLDNLEYFPNVEHDDDIDSITQYINNVGFGFNVYSTSSNNLPKGY